MAETVPQDNVVGPRCYRCGNFMGEVRSGNFWCWSCERLNPATKGDIRDLELRIKELTEAIAARSHPERSDNPPSSKQSAGSE